MARSNANLKVISQDNSVKWTKATRGADRAVQRPRMDNPAALTQMPSMEDKVWRQNRHASEKIGFELREFYGDPPEWFRRECGLLEDIIRLHRKGDVVEISLAEPSKETRQTRWPYILPSPTAVLQPETLVRIDWNMRSRVSLFGLNRGSYFEEHTIFIAFTATPSRDMFMKRQQYKHLDFRTNIY
jgi:hypothetical protein